MAQINDTAKARDERANLELETEEILHKVENNDRPAVQLIGLDLNFARIGTVSMLAKFFLSFFAKPDDDNEFNPKTKLSTIDEALLKIRQLCQYSIHARPEHGARPPDDISSDTVHNLQAATLGKLVYNLNAFIAPWISFFKNSLWYSQGKILGLPARMLDSFDKVVGKLTNIFWNSRRFSMSLVPYDGGMKTEKLAEKQNIVRDFVNFLYDKFLGNNVQKLKQLFAPDQASEIKQIPLEDISSNYDWKKVLKEIAGNYWGNVCALFNRTYMSAHNFDGKPQFKVVGSEEPDNNPLYVRSKILSHILGLPAGLLGSAANSLSIAFNIFGSFVDSKSFLRRSESLTNFANSLMAIVYMTGEVPANINEYFKQKKYKKHANPGHLLVAGVGVFGMLNRMKYAPIISSLFNGIGLRNVLDKWHNQLEQLFLGFFSLNRWVLHTNEKRLAESIATASEKSQAKKHESWIQKILLPIKVLLMDPDVTYRENKFDLIK